MRTIFLILIVGFGTGCGEKEADTSATGECSVSDDCEQLHYNWDAVCEEEILMTPTGSGMNECIEGECVVDFEVVETDCSEQGLVCGEDEQGNAACVAGG